MDGVPVLRFSKELPNRSGLGLRWISGADCPPESGDSVISLENHWHAGPRGHELRQRSEKRPLAVNLIEGAGLRIGEPENPRRDDLESGLLEVRDDLSG